MNSLTCLALEASVSAGKAIIEVYNSNHFSLRVKDDNSPLTEADLQSHCIIEKALRSTSIPILSEEGDIPTYNMRKSWGALWIVDPLDGTKEFVKRNGEFTVNIALVEKQRPVMGVVFAPVLGCLYWGDESGAYKAILSKDWMEQQSSTLIDQLEVQQIPNVFPRELTVVASVSHLSPETEHYLNVLQEKENKVNIASKGSSLKMCLVAEGSAHLYPRLGPTMEWDTAAGQAIIEASGGKLYNWSSRQTMIYNRRELQNEWFLAVANGVDINTYWPDQ